MTPLTERQALLLNLIDDRVLRTGRSPTYEELLAPLGLRSRSMIFRMVQRLVDLRYLSHQPCQRRSLVVLRRPPGSPFEVFERLITLNLELCDAVDNEADDIGGRRRGSLTILREIGPVAEAARAAISGASR